MEGKLKKAFLCSLIFVALLFAPPLVGLSVSQDSGGSQSDEADSWWKDRADLNKDGTLDDQEISAWKDLERERLDVNQDGKIDDQEKRLVWKLVRSPITTELEQRFDADNSGWLEPEESRKLLFRRVDFIFDTNGSLAMKTGLEELYDANADGIVDLEELKSLREDLR